VKLIDLNILLYAVNEDSRKPYRHSLTYRHILYSGSFPSAKSGVRPKPCEAGQAPLLIN